MDRKIITREYKETPRTMGVFQIIKKVNSKMLLGSSVNLPAILNRHKSELKLGSHRNEELQMDWKQYGEKAFDFNMLEVLEPADDPGYDPTEDLKVLEKLWIDKLSPFGDRGYHKPPSK